MHTAGDTRSPSSIFATAIAIAGLLGAAAAVFFSLVVRAFGCEDGGDCSPGTALVVIACIGVFPVIAMLIESFRRTGHPWYWFIAGAFVYGFWGVVFMSLVG